MAFRIGEGDLLPELSGTLRDANRRPLDLSLASSVEFFLRRDGETTYAVNGRTATILQVGDGSDGSKGKVKYSWVNGDTDEPADDYIYDWLVNWLSGKPEHFPNGNKPKLIITANV